MKRLLSICFAALLTLSANAESEIPEDAVNVSLTEVNPGEVGQGSRHKAPVKRPTIFYQDNSVFVQAPYNVDAAQIVIYDTDDNIIFNTIISLVPGANTLLLPQIVADEKCSIELVYGNHDYLGYF